MTIYVLLHFGHMMPLLHGARENNLIAKERFCAFCNSPVTLVDCSDRKDRLKWECRNYSKAKRHRKEVSIRKGSWIEQSNLSPAETLKLKYFPTKMKQLVVQTNEFKSTKVKLERKNTTEDTE